MILDPHLDVVNSITSPAARINLALGLAFSAIHPEDTHTERWMRMLDGAADSSGPR